MTVRLILGDVRAQLARLAANSVDCVVTSPPYWGLRSYLDAGDPDKPLEIGLEPTLGEHLDAMVSVFRMVRRVLRPHGSVWLNYGDCYAAAPNGKSAAAYKADGSDDRTFRDKPFSTVGPVRNGRTYFGDGNDGSRGVDRDFHDAHRPKAGPIRGGAHDGDEAWQRAFDGADRAATRAQAGPIFDLTGGASGGGVRGANKGNTRATPKGRVVAGGYLKPKDLCMIPNRLAIALQDDGWWVRSEIIWHKPSPMPESVYDRPTNAHEKIWLLTKRQDYYYNHEAVREPVSGGAHRRAGKNSRENVDHVPRSRKPTRGRSTYGRHTLGEEIPEAARRPGVSPKSAPHGIGVRANEAFHAATVGEIDTRALRNVWTIPSRGFNASKPQVELVPVPASEAQLPGASGNERGGDTARITSRDCSEHGDLPDLLPKGFCDGLSSDQLKRIRGTGTGRVQGTFPGSDTTVHIDNHSLAAPPTKDCSVPERASTATSRNNRSRKTDRDFGSSSRAIPCEGIDESTLRTTPSLLPIASIFHGIPQSRTSADSSVSHSSQRMVADNGGSSKSENCVSCRCAYYRKVTSKAMHFATFPERIAERCILAGTPPTVCGFCGRVAGCEAPMCSAVPRVPGTVLDPFGGSGTVGAVADRLGRDAVLIDLKPEYVELARARIFGAQPPDIAEAAE